MMKARCTSVSTAYEKHPRCLTNQANAVLEICFKVLYKENNLVTCFKICSTKFVDYFLFADGVLIIRELFWDGTDVLHLRELYTLTYEI